MAGGGGGERETWGDKEIEGRGVERGGNGGCLGLDVQWTL